MALWPGNSYSTTCPAVSAGATWTVTHNLGTRTCTAQVWRAVSPFDLITTVRIEATTVNTLSVFPDIAMTSGDYLIVVKVGGG